jgi:copper chaperone
MLTFEVSDMTCGHCAGTISRAIREADPGAEVVVDLARHRVVVRPGSANAQGLGDAIREAGYTPVQVTDAAA